MTTPDRRYHDEHAPQPPSYREVPKEKIQSLGQQLQSALEEAKKVPKVTSADGLETSHLHGVGLVVRCHEHNRKIDELWKEREAFLKALNEIKQHIDAAYRLDTPAALINSLGEIGRLVDKALKS